MRVLSGMSTLEQVEDNVSFMKDFQPLNDREKEIINPKGISAAAILDCYNSCMLQPVPTFGAEHNYFTSEKAKHP